MIFLWTDIIGYEYEYHWNTNFSVNFRTALLNTAVYISVGNKKK